MPFRIDKVKTGYRIYNLEKKQYTKPIFKTKRNAMNMKKVWENFDRNFK